MHNRPWPFYTFLIG